MNVSENRGKNPKMDGKIKEHLIKIDDLGVKPTIFGNPHIPEV